MSGTGEATTQPVAAATEGGHTEAHGEGRPAGEGRGRGGRGGFGRGGARGGRGGGPGGPGGRGGPRDDKDWMPLTKLGRLVKYGMIKSLEEIYTHSIPIKESEIVDELLKKSKKELSDEVMKIISVQKQTKAG